MKLMTPRQIKAARASLGWTREKLADKAGLHEQTIAQCERKPIDAILSTRSAKKMKAALVNGGVSFDEAGRVIV